MQEVKLKLADNGVIKTVTDDNINGGGESFESTTVYEFNSPISKIKFIEELCIDLGLEFGNSRSKQQIQVNINWGSDYSPSKGEADRAIKKLELEIKELSNIKNG